jgi:hypothetical protein
MIFDVTGAITDEREVSRYRFGFLNSHFTSPKPTMDVFSECFRGFEVFRGVRKIHCVLDARQRNLFRDLKFQ